MACLQSNDAMPGNVTDLLVQIKDAKGRKIAQYLEAPGEVYFNPANPAAQPPLYLQQICGGGVPNKKVFVFILDFDSSPTTYTSLRANPVMRDAYSNRLIGTFKKMAQPKDKFILLYNKIDKTSFGTVHQIINKSAAEKEARDNYGYVFKSLRKEFFGGFFHYDKFKFQVFSTGSFTDGVDDQGNPIQHYVISDDIYPRQLWTEIMRKL